jgi:hypothetical protein
LGAKFFYLYKDGLYLLNGESINEKNESQISLIV